MHLDISRKAFNIIAVNGRSLLREQNLTIVIPFVAVFIPALGLRAGGSCEKNTGEKVRSTIGGDTGVQ